MKRRKAQGGNAEGMGKPKRTIEQQHCDKSLQQRTPSSQIDAPENHIISLNPMTATRPILQIRSNMEHALMDTTKDRSRRSRDRGRKRVPRLSLMFSNRKTGPSKDTRCREGSAGFHLRTWPSICWRRRSNLTLWWKRGGVRLLEHLRACDARVALGQGGLATDPTHANYC